jgi:hypothetical protein
VRPVRGGFFAWLKREPRFYILDVGADLGSTVSLDYYDRRPFEFNGKIGNVMVDVK